MTFSFKKTTYKDVELYLHCLKNNEFKKMLFDNDNFNTIDFASPSSIGEKYIVNCNGISIGFFHLYKCIEYHSYDIIGGILPEKIGNGIGSYACVAALSYIFSKYSNITITSGIFKFNMRSYFMHKSVGFYEIAETPSKKIMMITKSLFCNKYTQDILSKIVVEYT